MSEQTIQVFIDGVVRYFHHTNDKEVRVGTPYLVENNNPAAYDITGIIGISGPYPGCVYFTAPRILLKHLLLSIGESDTSNEHILIWWGRLPILFREMRAAPLAMNL